jgi:hypothetical protein
VPFAGRALSAVFSSKYEPSRQILFGQLWPHKFQYSDRHFALGSAFLCGQGTERRLSSRVIELVKGERAVVLDEEILARIRAAKVWDKDSRLEDFQIRAHENGLVLVNLKTGRAQLLYDEDSELHDWKVLFPNLVLPSEHDKH